ncbi:MAG TPA: hypothetical protein VJX23_12060 [Candidatus Binataceae bacterium]|nr:hypothetical protein [Candidatus Binataceae bacterium]
MAPSKESFRLSTRDASFLNGEVANGPLNLAMLALLPQPHRLQEPARAHGRADAQVEYTPARIVPPATAQKRRRTERVEHRIAEAENDPLVDRLSNLFATDAILASQFFDLRKSVSPGYRPIQKLMLAVLGDGIEYFLGKGCYHAHPFSRCAVLRSEAGKWIFDEAAAGPFSFNWICDGLQIGQSYLRAGIRRVEAQIHGETSKGLC